MQKPKQADGEGGLPGEHATPRLAMARRVTGSSVTRIRRRQGFLWIPACAGMTEGAGPLSCPFFIPAGLPLSFPPVVSGNPVFCFFVPLFVWACMGKPWIPD